MILPLVLFSITLVCVVAGAATAVRLPRLAEPACDDCGYPLSLHVRRAVAARLARVHRVPRGGVAAAAVEHDTGSAPPVDEDATGSTDVPATCPECGADLAAEEAIAFGTPDRSRRRILLGGGIGFVGGVALSVVALGFVRGLGGPGAFAPAAPFNPQRVMLGPMASPEAIGAGTAEAGAYEADALAALLGPPEKRDADLARVARGVAAGLQRGRDDLGGAAIALELTTARPGDLSAEVREAARAAIAASALLGPTRVRAGECIEWRLGLPTTYANRTYALDDLEVRAWVDEGTDGPPIDGAVRTLSVRDDLPVAEPLSWLHVGLRTWCVEAPAEPGSWVVEVAGRVVARDPADPTRLARPSGAQTTSRGEATGTTVRGPRGIDLVRRVRLHVIAADEPRLTAVPEAGDATVAERVHAAWVAPRLGVREDVRLGPVVDLVLEPAGRSPVPVAAAVVLEVRTVGAEDAGPVRIRFGTLHDDGTPGTTPSAERRTASLPVELHALAPDVLARHLASAELRAVPLDAPAHPHFTASACWPEPWRIATVSGDEREVHVIGPLARRARIDEVRIGMPPHDEGELERAGDTSRHSGETEAPNVPGRTP